jgi:hypothetical protein
MQVCEIQPKSLRCTKECLNKSCTYFAKTNYYPILGGGNYPTILTFSKGCHGITVSGRTIKVTVVGVVWCGIRSMPSFVNNRQFVQISQRMISADTLSDGHMMRCIIKAFSFPYKVMKRA